MSKTYIRSKDESAKVRTWVAVSNQLRNLQYAALVVGAPGAQVQKAIDQLHATRVPGEKLAQLVARIRDELSLFY